MVDDRSSWEVTRHVLGWYFATVSQIQVVYGSLTTSVGIPPSVELGALVLLLGGQVIAELPPEVSTLAAAVGEPDYANSLKNPLFSLSSARRSHANAHSKASDL